ncbi:SDR-family protein [Sesbania bispinosa]|nr:SDR-family protein [Sesbania bispinosa]
MATTPKDNPSHICKEGRRSERGNRRKLYKQILTSNRITSKRINEKISFTLSVTPDSFKNMLS